MGGGGGGGETVGKGLLAYIEAMRKLPCTWEAPLVLGTGFCDIPLRISSNQAQILAFSALTGQLSSVASGSLPVLPPQWPFPGPSAERTWGRFLSPTHRPIIVVFFYKLPVVIVVESGVALDGLLLTQVLVLIFDTVNSSTGDLWVKQGRVSTGVSSLRAEAWALCIDCTVALPCAFWDLFPP